MGGEEVVMAHEDQPQVKGVPVRPAPTKRVCGPHRGQIGIHPDCDAPLPDAFWLSGTP